MFEGGSRLRFAGGLCSRVVHWAQSWHVIECGNTATHAAGLRTGCNGSRQGQVLRQLFTENAIQESMLCLSTNRDCPTLMHASLSRTAHAASLVGRVTCLLLSSDLISSELIQHHQHRAAVARAAAVPPFQPSHTAADPLSELLRAR